MKKTFVLSALAMALSSYAFSANAFVATYTEGQTTSLEAGAVTETFASGVLPADYEGGKLYNASSTNVTAQPVGSTDYFWSIGNSPEQAGPGVITFTTPVTYFGFLWGSIDAYNTVSFYTTDSETPYVFTGTDIVDPATGNQAVSVYFEFYDATITKIVFESTNNAFETDNHAIITAVPEPETYAMMLAGLGLMGFMAKRRKG